MLRLSGFFVALFSASVLSAQPQPSQQSGPAYEQKEVRVLVQLVQDASDELATRGEVSFADFGQRGGRWYQEDRYVVVFDTDMIRVVYPPVPARAGESCLEFTDADGRPYYRWMKEISDKGQGASGWVHYRQEKTPPAKEWRSSFLRRTRAPSGKEYVVAAGLSGLKAEKKFVQDMVEAARALIEDAGEAAFELIRDKNGKFVYRDSYVVVLSADGVCLVQPEFPDMEGEKLSTHRDPKGNLDVLSVINLARRGGGWRYAWMPRSGGRTPRRRFMYILPASHAGTAYVVGAVLPG